MNKKITYIKVGFPEIDRVRQEKLERFIKSGIKTCKGHKNTNKQSMYDDESAKASRLFKEQCSICGGYLKEVITK